jgi:peptidylprolyl isomerase
VLPGPKGSAVKAPAGTPKLLTKGATPTGFDFTHAAAKPKQLRIVPLVKGTGPRIESGDLITVNYLGVVWGKGKPFDESYSKQPATFPIGLGRVIPAWDQGLVGIRQGSRVLLLCPPDAAYGAQGSGSTIPGNATLAFVVDVLGVG